jgi:hypothetical protein
MCKRQKNGGRQIIAAKMNNNKYRHRHAAVRDAVSACASRALIRRCFLIIDPKGDPMQPRAHSPAAKNHFSIFVAEAKARCSIGRATLRAWGIDAGDQSKTKQNEAKRVRDTIAYARAAGFTWEGDS